MGFYQFKMQQQVHASLDEVWEFISAPKNLKKITPDHMGFEITNQVPAKMYPGMIISYKVSPILGIKMTWVTEITHIKDKEYFVDEQRIGPYVMWHHEHHLIENDEGILMKDIVSYQPPLGILGSMANSIFIKKQLKEIFDYRRKAVDEYFG